ncbi:MAG: helix-turn-helix transcriptional regulator [Cyclobacteriaceae bacterium]|nr:helix-turn-helix transcriptional regulator [Cyclobacteriaceae bacterium]
MEVNSIDEKFLIRLIDMVELHMSNEKFGVEQLGDELGMSRSQLHRKLTGLLGRGPNQFIRTFRLQRAHDLLKQKAATASEISYQVGFGSPSYFTKCFHEQFGYTPSDMLVHE